MKGGFYADLKRMSDTYGNLVRIAPNKLVSTDVEELRRMSSTRAGYSRADWYRSWRFIPHQNNVFSLVDEKKHTDLRTRLGPGYSPTPVVEAAIDRQLMRMTRLIDTRFLSTDDTYRPLDFVHLTHFCALDIIGDLAYGKPFGFLDEGKDKLQFIKWNEGFFPMAMAVSVLPWLTKLLHRRPFSYLFPTEKDAIGFGRFIALAKETVVKRFHDDISSKRNRDMMALFIAHGVSADEALNEMLLQIPAGTDSIAVVIRMTLLYLINTPRCYLRVIRELDEAVAAKKLSTPIRDCESRRLPYLQAVIREGLRIFPGTTPLVFKKVPKGGDTISGYIVPEGTEIGHNVYGILRSTRYWGADAECFRPERWLGLSEANAEEMSSIVEAVFGFGKYKCLGRGIAALELNKILPELLRRYEFSVVNAPKPLNIINSGMFLMSDFWVRVTRREGEARSAV